MKEIIMRLEIACVSILFIVSVYASSSVVPKNDHERFLVASGTFSFTTFTLIKVSTTTTSTFTTTSTCTTSTAALTTCTVGRRRRGFFYDNSRFEDRQRRGLFYDENEAESKDGTAFLPTENTENDPVNEVLAKSHNGNTALIPLEIQNGFSLPESFGSNRFLLSFGTSTVTSISITTTYVSLTAICSSTSGFPLCGGVGK